MREIKNEFENFKETNILGAYETRELRWVSDNDGFNHRAFEDTDITKTEDKLILERHMLVGKSSFLVCSIFPNINKVTATDKMLRIVENDLTK